MVVAEHDTELEAIRRLRRWRTIIRAVQGSVFVAVAIAVFVIAVRPGDDDVPVLPQTETQFSLDLEVIGELDHRLVYAVEQRARPAYRIFSFDPSAGVDETVFTVPTDAIIYGMALSPDRTTLALSYSTDFAIGGSGLWLFDLTTSALTEVSPAVPDRYLADLAWSPTGDAVLATHVDRTGEAEQLSVVSVALDSAVFSTVADDAINPAMFGDSVYFLRVGDDKARRSVGLASDAGAIETLPVGDETLDLDHLLASADHTVLHLAVLDVDAGGDLTVGDAAEAHGNHDVESRWWELDVDGEGSVPLPAEPAIVYDAASTEDGIVYATQEGLSIAVEGQRVDLIRSRAIRFVAS